MRAAGAEEGGAGDARFLAADGAESTACDAADGASTADVATGESWPMPVARESAVAAMVAPTAASASNASLPPTSAAFEAVHAAYVHLTQVVTV